MTDTFREKTKMMSRANRIRGQLEAIERALEEETSYSNVLHLIASTRGAINSLMVEVLDEHIRIHVADPSRENDPTCALAVEELIEAVHRYLK
jgi:FrmR/RcnR family transcriptional regulator, repressor of frmRAB operon